MLSRYNRYIKYNPLKAKLYQRLSPDNIQYMFFPFYSASLLASVSSSWIQNGVASSAFILEQILCTLEQQTFNLKNGELNALEFQYNRRTFGIVTKPFLFYQLQEMLQSQQQSTIISEMSTIQEHIEKQTITDKIKNHFVSSFTVSQDYATYQSKFTISNNLGIAVQKNGNQIQIFLNKNNKIKLVHSMEIIFKKQVSRIRVVNETEFLCISFKNESMLWFYNIDTGEISEFDLNVDFGIHQLGIIDFILPQEVTRQEILIMTHKSLYLLNLSKHLKQEKSVSEILLPGKLPSQRYAYLQGHSLSCYLVVTQNIHQKRNYRLHIIKNFGSNNVIITAPVFKKIIDADFASKMLLSCFDDGTIEFSHITSLDNQGKFKEPIKLKIKDEDRTQYNIKKEQKFSKVKISFNRTYVIGVIQNLMLIWRTQSLLTGDSSYEVCVFRKKILAIENWKTNGENLWVALEDKNCVICLTN